MTTPIEVSSESGIVAVADAGRALPAGRDQAALLRELEPMASAGEAFYFVADDPVRFRIDVASGDALPPELEAALERQGGAFRLDVPSGRLLLRGWDAAGKAFEAGGVAVAPGRHALSVFGRRPFDGARHAAEMSDLLGSEWTYMQRVDRLGLAGCLPLVAATIAAAAGRWSWMWVVVPLLLVTWVPSLLLRSGRRYKEAELRAAEHDRARPHYVLRIAPGAGETVPGGFLRV